MSRLSLEQGSNQTAMLRDILLRVRRATFSMNTATTTILNQMVNRSVVESQNRSHALLTPRHTARHSITAPRQNGIDPKKFHGRNEDSHDTSPNPRKSLRISANKHGVDYQDVEWGKRNSQGKNGRQPHLIASSKSKTQEILEIDDDSDEDSDGSRGKSDFRRSTVLDSIPTPRRSTRNEGKQSIDKRMVSSENGGRTIHPTSASL
jgi:hypothetical protein